MSKILASHARHRINSSEGRGPASTNSPSLKSTQGPFDRSFSRLSEESAARGSLKLHRKKVLIENRKFAQSHFEQSGWALDATGNLAAFRGLRALPLSEVEGHEELLKKANVLGSQWAIYSDESLPQGKIPVYDFENDRWGVLSGMIEVSIPEASDYEHAVSEVEALGYRSVRLPHSKDLLFVVAKAATVDGIQQVSDELKKSFGSHAVKAETLFVWRAGQ